MKNIKLTVAFSLFSILASTTVYADESVRLVVTQKTGVAEKSTKIKSVSDCINSTDNTDKWCPKSDDSIVSQSFNGKNIHTTVIKVPTKGYSEEQIKKAFEESGQYDTVEVDVRVKSTPTPTDFVYAQSSNESSDDIASSYQDDYYAENAVSPTGSGITNAQSLSSSNPEPVDVFVLDSMFTASDDMVYSSGANFTTVSDEIPSDDYTNRESETELTCGFHGAGIASVIGSTTNNGLGINGILDNVKVHPIRVMECGNGYLSDSARALNYIADNYYEGVTPHNATGGIINMSLAGISDVCPEYLQDAINNATAAGFIVAVAVGNEGESTSNRSPANCENTIAVGSIDRQGNLATFSNYGSEVDIVAAGYDIVSSSTGDSTYLSFWEGTSFSTPLVTGSLALAYQEYKFDYQTALQYLKTTAYDFNEVSTCIAEECGNGILNASGMMALNIKTKNNALNTIQYSLGTETTCDQEWLLSYFGDKARLCELFTVTFFGGYINDNQSYEVVSHPNTESFDYATSVAVGIFEQGIVKIEDIDADNNSYKFRICEDGLCSEDWLELNSSKATTDNKPVNCN